MNGNEIKGIITLLEEVKKTTQLHIEKYVASLRMPSSFWKNTLKHASYIDAMKRYYTSNVVSTEANVGSNSWNVFLSEIDESGGVFYDASRKKFFMIREGLDMTPSLQKETERIVKTLTTTCSKEENILKCVYVITAFKTHDGNSNFVVDQTMQTFEIDLDNNSIHYYEIY